MNKTNYSFLVIGATKESTEGVGFKRYVGIGSSYVVGFNPNKKKLDELMGFESANDPEYIVDGDNGKEVRATFIVRTDPETCNGVEITNRATITLRNAPAYNRDETKVQVIDKYGNSVWANAEDAKAHKKIMYGDNPAKIDDNYRIAKVGEAALVDFLKNYLNVGDCFTYTNGVWSKDESKAKDCEFALEDWDKYFKGDFSEIVGALALQPNNKIKLLYGVRTTEDNKQYQAVCTDVQMTMKNGTRSYKNIEKNLNSAKAGGKYANTEYAIQELAEYAVEATPMAAAPAQTEESPW